MSFQDLATPEEIIGHLAAIDRPSASAGEREAAQWIRDRLRQLGAQVTIDEEKAHGTYWWPLGINAAIGAAAGVMTLKSQSKSKRLFAAAVSAAAAAAIADDVSGGKLWFRRAFLRHKPTTNVVAETGDRSATKTIVFVAHHDAARWSLLFHPAPMPFIAERFPKFYAKLDSTPAVAFPVFAGPAFVALGELLASRPLKILGTILAAGTTATMLEIASRSTVPGANDNLSGVATLIGIAAQLQEQPAQDIRVLLVSTGSEESFMEGMQAFARRHFPKLDLATTEFVCLDTVGSDELLMLEAEGMLKMRDYPVELKTAVSACAQRVGVQLRRGLRFRNGTDGLIALRAGYPTVMIGSINKYRLPSNYHWPTDTAENINYKTVRDAVKLCVEVVRSRAKTTVS